MIEPCNNGRGDVSRLLVGWMDGWMDDKCKPDRMNSALYPVKAQSPAFRTNQGIARTTHGTRTWPLVSYLLSAKLLKTI